MLDYEKPVYLISIVAKVLSIHPQTLRQYEREGLVCPSRTQGKMRLYSQRDIDRIKLILRLTKDLGVNLAGVDIILRLREKLDEHESTIANLNDKLHGNRQTSTALVERNSYDIIIFGE